MKKFIAFCSSLVLTLSAVSSINTGAAELDPNTYIPTLYFSAEDNDDIHILPSGRTIFINLNEVSGKSAIEGKIRLYFNDALNLTGQIVAKWVWQGNGVELTNIYTPEEAGFKNPYDNSAASYVLTAKAYPEDKLMSVAYTNVLSTPLVPTDGESSKYPLAVFDYSVDTSANAGRYAIDFKTEQPNITNLVYRLPDGGIRDIRPNGNNVQSIYIALSDRKLGDLDNNGKINSIDASGRCQRSRCYQCDGRFHHSHLLCLHHGRRKSRAHRLHQRQKVSLWLLISKKSTKNSICLRISRR